MKIEFNPGWTLIKTSERGRVLPAGDEIVLVTGLSGYKAPNDRYVMLAYLRIDELFHTNDGKVRWREMTGDLLSDGLPEPTHWARQSLYLPKQGEA